MKPTKWLYPLFGLSFVATGALYSHLPARVPIHWNLNGEVDRYGERPFVFLLALLPLFVDLLLLYLPKLDPNRRNYARHQTAFSAFRWALGLFLVAIHWISMLAAMGQEVSVGLLIPVGVGMLFVVIGNFLPQLKPNWFMGIRLPWTLADERVWKKTHRMGGWLFAISGLATIIAAFISPKVAFIVLIGTLGALLAGVTLYSIYLYKKLHPEN